MNAALLHIDANGGGDGAERDAGARDQRLEQHVARARAQAIAAGRGMQSGRGERLAGLNAARNAVAERAVGLQRDDGRVRRLAVLRLQRRLQFLQLFGVHGSNISAEYQTEGEWRAPAPSARSARSPRSAIRRRAARRWCTPRCSTTPRPNGRRPPGSTSAWSATRSP